MSQNEDAFSVLEFKNWKKKMQRFKEHVASHSYKAYLAKFQAIVRGDNVLQQVNEEKKQLSALCESFQLQIFWHDKVLPSEVMNRLTPISISCRGYELKILLICDTGWKRRQHGHHMIIRTKPSNRLPTVFCALVQMK